MRAPGLWLWLLLLPAATTLDAQQQVSVSAVLPVVSPASAGTRSLSFGSIPIVENQIVVVSVPASRAPASANRQSGEFRFNIGSASGIEFVIGVPSELNAGSNTPLSVSFNSSEYGGLCVTSGGSQCDLTGFNPAGAAPVRVCRETLGSGGCDPARIFTPGTELSIYIGGMVSVPPTATPTLYTGTITLTITQVY